MSAPRADSIETFRHLARARLPRAVFDFIDGAAGEEVTMRRNSADFARFEWMPQVLTDVTRRESKTPILGRDSAMPLIVAPTGLAALVWPRADLLLARAARDAGVPFIISTSSSERLEDIVAAAPEGRYWFQIYPYKDRRIVEALVERSRAAGVEALVLTVDTPVLGHRARDFKNRFSVPLRPNLRLAWDCLRCPLWTWGKIRYGVPRMKNLLDYGHGTSLESLSALMASNLNPGATWADLGWIRSLWRDKFVLKGLLNAACARRAAEEGVDAIVISNHGGRQLDGAPSSISCLADVVDAVAGRLEVYLDSGIRSGAHMARALSLGAHAVMIGRATLFGVACAGEDGATAVLSLLRSQLDTTLALIGCPDCATLDRSFIRKAHADE